MPLVTLFAALGAAVLLEAACLVLVPNRWLRTRFVVQPLLGATIGYLLPTGLLAMAPMFDHWLSALLGAVVATLVAMAGLFNQRFFLGPSDADVRASGMRSTLLRR